MDTEAEIQYYFVLVPVIAKPVYQPRFTLLRWASNYGVSLKVEPDISVIASLIGDPTRASMLTALMGGKALTATELAIEADITAQTASSHLSKLVDKKLLIVRKQGRHKYFQLHGYEIAELIESLLIVTSKNHIPKVITGPNDAVLRKARVCYDHLAGELGVALYDVLKSKKFIVDNANETKLTKAGESFFCGLGFEKNQTKASKRAVCKSCLDWSERRDHLAGILGQWILNDTFNRGWAAKDIDSRAVTFTPRGLQLFKKKYSISEKLFTLN